MIMFITHISTALRQLTKNIGRSVLTMLGIVIGIGSVIFIMTVGEVAKNFLLGQITQFGTNVVEIATPGTFGPFGESEEIVLTDDDVQAIEDSPLLSEVTAISAGYSVVKSVEYNGKTSSVSLFGDRPGFFDVNNVHAIKGRLYTTSDVQNSSRVVVIGERLSKDLFGHTDVIGEQIKIGGTFFTIIGLVEDINFGPNIGVEIVYAPLSTIRNLFVDASESNQVSFILVEFTTGTQVESFINRLEYELRRLHNVLDTEEEVFVIISREQFLEIFDTVLLGIQAFVSAVAAISLLVGGIGIMNIMLVTVKERTKEIGLRKAIGAPNGSILSQFLIESIVLTTVGGILGICAGIGLSGIVVFIAQTLQPDWGIHFVFVPQALIIACGVAFTVGIIFGLYPAFKASKLDPIEALHYE